MTNREEWFLKAVEQLKQKVFGPHGYSIPKFRCGVGWPTGNRKKVGAQCFDSKNSGDKTYEIFVSPKFDEPYEIIEMLVHELCHAIAGIAAGHRKEFIAVMKAVGMVKPWTGSKAGDVLTPVLETVVNEIGPYPHAKLGQKDKDKKQTTRLLKVQCPQCEYVARVTRKWLDELGGPLCPVHKVAFVEAEPEEK